jgi:hypothetical protein
VRFWDGKDITNGAAGVSIRRCQSDNQRGKDDALTGEDHRTLLCYFSAGRIVNDKGRYQLEIREQDVVKPLHRPVLPKQFEPDLEAGAALH